MNNHTKEAAAAADMAAALAEFAPSSGWPSGMLQDDSKGLSKWLSNQPNARQEARDAAAPQPVALTDEVIIGLWEKTVADYHGQVGLPRLCVRFAHVIAKQGGVAAPATAAQESWQPMHTAPTDGTYIDVQQRVVYRWLPYKANSQEFKRGKKGRWQRHTGYGFDSCELVGSGWQSAKTCTAIEAALLTEQAAPPKEPT